MTRSNDKFGEFVHSIPGVVEIYVDRLIDLEWCNVWVCVAQINEQGVFVPASKPLDACLIDVSGIYRLRMRHTVEHIVAPGGVAVNAGELLQYHLDIPPGGIWL